MKFRSSFGDQLWNRHKSSLETMILTSALAWVPAEAPGNEIWEHKGGICAASSLSAKCVPSGWTDPPLLPLLPPSKMVTAQGAQTWELKRLWPGGPAPGPPPSPPPLTVSIQEVGSMFICQVEPTWGHSVVHKSEAALTPLFLKYILLIHMAPRETLRSDPVSILLGSETKYKQISLRIKKNWWSHGRSEKVPKWNLHQTWQNPVSWLSLAWIWLSLPLWVPSESFVLASLPASNSALAAWTPRSSLKSLLILVAQAYSD